MQLSKRFLERAKTNLRRYQKVLGSAHSRDVNESDTCVIVSDFLADVLGYDKYSEVTTEFAVKSTFCDLAIRVGGKLQFLIEVKSIGTDLRENHLRQATDYAANQGVEWIVLTNGATWQAYRVRFEQPIQTDQVFTINLLDEQTRTSDLVEKLYLISKEGANTTAIESYFQRKEATSRYVIAQLLLTSPILAAVRRQLRQLYPGLRVEEADIAELLESEVLKRDALEGDRAVTAARTIRKAARKRERSQSMPQQPTAPTAATPSAVQLHG
jgi:predicted type IV restriction endonuclease